MRGRNQPCPNQNETQVQQTTNQSIKEKQVKTIRTLSAHVGLWTVLCALPLTATAQSTKPQVPSSLSAQDIALNALAKRPKPARQTDIAFDASRFSPTGFNSDQGPGPGPLGPGPGCNLFPQPPSVGAVVPLSYFGPP